MRSEHLCGVCSFDTSHLGPTRRCGMIAFLSAYQAPPAMSKQPVPARCWTRPIVPKLPCCRFAHLFQISSDAGLGRSSQSFRAACLLTRFSTFVFPDSACFSEVPLPRVCLPCTALSRRCNRSIAATFPPLSTLPRRSATVTLHLWYHEKGTGPRTALIGWSAGAEHRKGAKGRTNTTHVYMGANRR